MVAGKSSQQLRTIRSSQWWRFEVRHPHFSDPVCGVRLYAMGTVTPAGRNCFETGFRSRDGRATARPRYSSSRTRSQSLGGQCRLKAGASDQTKSCSCEHGESAGETEPRARGFAVERERDRYEISRCVTCGRSVTSQLPSPPRAAISRGQNRKPECPTSGAVIVESCGQAE